MLWHATSPCTEASDDRNFTVRWRACGFGIWVAEAWCQDVKLDQFVGDDRTDVGQQARTRCTLHAGGWLK